MKSLTESGGGATTVIAAVVCAMPGADARRVVVPRATPFTVTVAEVKPAGTVTVGATVAIDVESVNRFSVRPPAGAGEESLSNVVAVASRTTLNDAGSKLR